MCSFNITRQGGVCKLVGVAEEDFFEFLEDRQSLVDIEEVARGEVGDEADGDDDAELGEGGEEGVVGGHEREEFGHGVGNASGNEAGGEHFFDGADKFFVDELVAGAIVKNAEKQKYFEDGTNRLCPTEAFWPKANVVK